jgi:hypothetical protein
MKKRSKPDRGTETCYYCGTTSTTTEHVPPRCLFPERKDAFGTDHRKNLITVPSCDRHNLEKSKEDEFLMACVTPAVGTNSAGYIQTQTKVRRAIDRRGGRLLDTITRDSKPATMVAPNGAEFPILVGKPDMPRLCRALEHVARGLYFHIRGRRFDGTCHVLPGFVYFPGQPELEVIKRIATSLMKQECTTWSLVGENEHIFSCGLGPVDQYGLIPMVMTFFHGIEVYVAFQPEGTKLPHRTLSEASPEDPLRIDLYFDEKHGTRKKPRAHDSSVGQEYACL